MPTTTPSFEKTEKTQDAPSHARASTRQFMPTPHTGLGMVGIQQTAGNLAIQRWLQSDAIQTKLGVSQPGDPAEREADRIGEQIVSSGSPPLIQRQCAACAPGTPCPTCAAEEGIQAKEVPGHMPHVAANMGRQLASLRGRGQPLPPSVRGFFEPRFGQDLNQVRVHTDAHAAEAARTTSARAFTTGQDVVFGAGEYAPDTVPGSKLLAHELVHVMQQRGPDASRQATIQRQPEPTPQATTGTGRCTHVGIELPDRIFFGGDRGAVTATVSTTVPPGDYQITYMPAYGRFSVDAIRYNPPEPPVLTVSAPSDSALFETYRDSVAREGVRLHVAGGRPSTGGTTEAATVPQSTITAAYAQSLDNAGVDLHADVYRTRLRYLPSGVEYDTEVQNLRFIQSEQLRRQASNLQIVGETGRPPGLPSDGSYVLQPATDLPADLLATIPEGQIFLLPTEPGQGVSSAGGEAPEGGLTIVTIEPLNANMQPLAFTGPPEAGGLRPTDITTPLAVGGRAMNVSIGAGLMQTGFAAAGPDAIGIVGVPRWSIQAPMLESTKLLGHTAVYVRRAGQIQIVRGHMPQLWQLLRNYGAVERGAAAVPAAISHDVSLFTMTAARSIEYPVSPAVAEAFAQQLPAVGAVEPGSGIPPQWTARPAVYRACTGSNCVLWAVSEAEEALGGVIGPARPGVSVTALAEGGEVLERTASQGRLIRFTRAVAAGEEAVAPALATGPPVASGMPRGLQVLKWGGRAFFVIGLATIPLEIFLAPPGQRVRTAVGAGAGFLGGFAAGAAAGLVCGPGAPVCSVVLGIVFGVAGALGARAFAESIYDAAVLLAEHPEAIVAPPSATTLVFRGGYGGLLRSPLDVANEMRRQQAPQGGGR